MFVFSFRPRISSAVFLLSLALVAPTLPAVAQDTPVPRSPLTRSSPFNPPTRDVFVADKGAGLDTGCTYNNSPEHPLIIDIAVPRSVGPVDGNGFLVDAQRLIDEQVIPATVRVILPAFDVDLNGSPPPENDEVLFNGQRLGTLLGDNGIWRLNSFAVDVRRIRFPAPGSSAPALNRVQVNVDTLGVGRWCTAVDWVALVLPIKLATGFQLRSTGSSNPIRVRTGSNALIQTVFDQVFDADCHLTTRIGTPGDYDDYPVSGPVQFASRRSGIGNARLHATLRQCPADPRANPKVKVAWKLAGTTLSGVASWQGVEGDIDLNLPSSIGQFDLELVFDIDGKKHDPIHRKLFTTWAAPTNGAPRVSWYERATEWAEGQSGEGEILSALLAGLYAHGRSHWRYGYNFDGSPIDTCSWETLVGTGVSTSACNWGDCYRFSEVFEAMAATLGIGGLGDVAVFSAGGRGSGFLTTGSPSLDPAFRGSARPVGLSAYDRYHFSSHSLRQKGGKYYDATFRGIYSGERSFIEADENGSFGRDGDGDFRATFEGWNLYRRPGTSYQTWPKFEYKPPTRTSPGLLLEGPPPAIEFTGNATYSLVDEDLDGTAEALEAAVEVRLNESGLFSIEGVLEREGELVADRPANESMLAVSATLDEIKGTHTVALRFSGEQIYLAGLDGPYELVLRGIADTGIVRATLATPPQDHTAFGETNARLASATETALDLDGDGKLDHIRVDVDLGVRKLSSLRLQAVLGRAEKTLVDQVLPVSLAAGAHRLSLYLDSAPIARSGVDGPYELTVDLTSDDERTLDGLQVATRPYSANDFSVLLAPASAIVDHGVDTNGNGLFELLAVDFEADLKRSGSYLLLGVLRRSGAAGAVFANASLDASAGPISVRLEFPGTTIRELGLDGPYTVEVLLRDAETLRELDAVELPQATGAYLATQFEDLDGEPGPIELTGQSTDHGVDLDGDGLFDQLEVEVEVRLARTDVYQWSAVLRDRGGVELGFDNRQASLGPGLARLRFVFPGAPIGKNGVAGPYQVEGLLVFGTAGDNLVAVDVAETSAYSSGAFENGPDVKAPQLTLAAGGVQALDPADHNYRTLAVSDFVIAASDDLDPGVSVDGVVILAVTSDEPDDAKGPGDGDTVDDAVLARGCRSVRLRAERTDRGNGRVYTVHLGVADATGNVGTANFRVIVPPAPGDAAIDDGPAHGVEGCKP